MTRWTLTCVANVLATMAVTTFSMVSHVSAREPSEGGTQRSARGIAVEEINEHPGFLVRVDVDRPDRTYKAGELMKVTVRTEREGYLYLFYCDADRAVSCIFPNRLQAEHKVPEGRAVEVPAAGARFRLRVRPPFGSEVLKAVVTTKPLRLDVLQASDLTRKDVTPIKLDQFEKAFVEARKRSSAADPGWAWAEHTVVVRTVDPAVDSARQPVRRVGLFIGVGKYADTRIPTMPAPPNDARMMAEAMTRAGNLDEAIVLTDERATLEAIGRAIREQLAGRTRVGDFVVIYWSSHGGRVADDNGDEKDGFDEYLVPHDGDISSLQDVRRTMLIDDTFGRWTQELDGRRLVVILDTCYSSGQGDKAAGGPPLGEAIFDFLDGEFTRAKDLGQSETALLGSSRADQISFTRKGAAESVMTYFLAERLRTSEGPLTLSEAYAHLSKVVPDYVEKAYPGATQTPVLIDYTSSPTELRPAGAREK